MKSRALIVIDMQAALVPGAYREQLLIDNINKLARQAREVGAPVLFVVHNHATFEPMMRGGEGWQISAALQRQPDEPVVEKTASDAFYQTSLATDLEGLGVEELVLTGLQTEYCVDTTARAALSHGFDVVLVADGHSTGDGLLTAEQMVAHHNASLANVAHPHRQIRVLPAAEVTFR